MTERIPGYVIPITQRVEWNPACQSIDPTQKPPVSTPLSSQVKPAAPPMPTVPTVPAVRSTAQRESSRELREAGASRGLNIGELEKRVGFPLFYFPRREIKPWNLCRMFGNCICFVERWRLLRNYKHLFEVFLWECFIVGLSARIEVGKPWPGWADKSKPDRGEATFPIWQWLEETEGTGWHALFWCEEKGKWLVTYMPH